MRIITDKFAPLVSFYENISGLPATRYGDVFAELSTSTCTLAIGSTQTLQAFHAEGVLYPAQNRSVIIEFLVEDVDKEFVRLKEHVADFVQEPTTMPWGNRSLLFRDPDGNLVNLFTPVTPEAVKNSRARCKFAGPAPASLNNRSTLDISPGFLLRTGSRNMRARGGRSGIACTGHASASACFAFLSSGTGSSLTTAHLHSALPRCKNVDAFR